MTYARSRGKKPFDWNRFLKSKTFTAKDLRTAHKLSGEWVTCACGVQCVKIPRTDGAPVDAHLRQLGFDFHDHISNMSNIPEARAYYQNEAIKTLEAIEKRAAQVLAQLG